MKESARAYIDRDNIRFFNRELSWVEFNRRVLFEAQKKTNPLLERLKFAAIVSSNFDEFFMVRVASLLDQIEAGFNGEDGSGLTPKQQVEIIYERVHEIYSQQYNCFKKSLLPALKREKIEIFYGGKVPAEVEAAADIYYNHMIFPVLTPLVVDSSRSFPLIQNRSLNIAVLMESKKDKAEAGLTLAIVEVPSVLPRYRYFPWEDEIVFMLLEDMILQHLDGLFSGHRIVASGLFRVTRNADLGLDEEGAEDLLSTIEQSIKMRIWGAAVRLEVNAGIDDRLLKLLLEKLAIPDKALYLIDGPLDLTFLMKLTQIDGYEHLRYPPIKPCLPEFLEEGQELTDVITEHDIVLHHPYHQFDPVVDLVKTAASDPSVLAIKQTLYRVSGNSPIVAALELAAENGKQVTALVELKARFDEENNIQWAKRLEKAGCHVIYGLKGLKTHAKMLLIVRAEDDGLKRYVHLGTGNYNDVTARLYSDIGLMTANPLIGADVSAVFNAISGYSELADLYRLVISPFELRNKMISLIREEAANKKAGKEARIVMKFNSLVDEAIIDELYVASCAGVSIDLIVRGICCLRPGIPGLSENIVVRSIVGRFLEHSRIFWFHADGQDLLYLSSADMMPRNLDRRLEVMFPLEDAHIRETVFDIVNANLKDTTNARVLNSTGIYTKVDRRGKERFDCQEYSYKQVMLNKSTRTNLGSRSFQPVLSKE